MNIVFLHLSDIHICEKFDVNSFQIQKIVDSLNIMGDFDQIIIVVSGDIAYSGKEYEYEYAWYLFGQLFAKLNKRYILKSRPYIFVVPGNHDVDLDKGDLGHAKIQELIRKKTIEKQIGTECEKLKCFYQFSKNNSCFVDSDHQLYCSKIINFNGYKIEINLLNSALFSTLDEEKGLHYFPQYVVNSLAEPTGADFVISIMHHSFHWFVEKIKSQLEEILLTKSSVIFLGHEHILKSQQVTYEEFPSVRILAGGVLCNQGDWSQSEYFAFKFTTETQEYSLYSFKWNPKERLYSHKLIEAKILPNKPSREKMLIPQKEYLDKIMEDEKHQLSKSINDYFVFPRLEKEEYKAEHQSIDLIQESKFISEIENSKRVIIVGYDNYGKTTLLKRLFYIYSKEKVVLFCNASNIQNSNYKRVIHNIFQDIYGENPEDFNRFEQLPKEDKFIIIDDIHLINPRHIEPFIDGIKGEFEYIILSTKKVVELDILERLKKASKNDQSFSRYRIMPFFTDKRYDLILNIVKIKVQGELDSQANIAKTLASALKKQRSLFNLDPEFIIQYTEYFCKNMKDAIQNDGEIFGKVFEANLVNSIIPHIKRISVDKLFIILDKIAYFIHINKKYPINQEELNAIVQKYNNDYDSDVSYVELIHIATSSKILTICEDGTNFKFSNKNYLAYFIAREINRKYHLDHDEKDIIQILNFSCFDINSNILLFLTYITDNIAVLKLILTLSYQYTNEWSEFCLNDINIPYLKNMSAKQIPAPAEYDKQNDMKCEIEEEKSNIQNELIDSVDLYDYKEEEADKLYNQLNRALSLLNTIARCLPNFEHMMVKSEKEEYVNLLYQLPNKIFYLWASNVERCKYELIGFIKEINERDYSRKKPFTISDAIELLQSDSLSLLLDIYNMTVIFSVNNNTERYLSSFNYSSNATYSLQHLMVLEQREKITDYIQESMKVYDSNKNVIIKNLVAWISHHVLLHSKSIERSEIQQIENKYFENSTDHVKLLQQRSQISKT